MKKMSFVLCIILLLTIIFASIPASASSTFQVGDLVVLTERGFAASDGTGGRMKSSLVGEVFEIKKISTSRWASYPYAIGFPNCSWSEGWVSADMISSFQNDNDPVTIAMHFANCSWFDYFFQSIPYNPTPMDVINFEVVNGEIGEVTVKQEEYSSYDNQFVISPEGSYFDSSTSTVTTWWRLTSQVNLKLFIDRFDLGISIMTGDVFEIPTAEDIVFDWLWDQVDIDELIVDDTIIVIRYELDPSGIVTCHLVED